MFTHTNATGAISQIFIYSAIAVIVVPIANFDASAEDGIAGNLLTIHTYGLGQVALAHSTDGRTTVFVGVVVAVVINCIADLFGAPIQGITGLELSILTEVDGFFACADSTAFLPQIFVGVAIAVVVESITKHLFVFKEGDVTGVADPTTFYAADTDLE